MKVPYQNNGLHSGRMRFASPDPLYSRYPGLSPWSHTAANPLNLIDPDGQEFSEALSKYVNDFREETDKIIKSNSFATGCKKDDYLAILSELNLMEDSKQLFDVGFHDNNGLGMTVYDTENDAVLFMFPKEGNSFALQAHEFSHGYQFLDGRIDLAVFDKESSSYVQSRTPLLNSFQNEREAYDRGFMYGGDMLTDSEIKFNPLYRFSESFRFSDPSSGVFTIKDCMKYPDPHSNYQRMSNITNSVFRINGNTYKPVNKKP